MPEHLQGVLYTAAVVPESMGGSGGPGANPWGLGASGSRITSRVGSGST